MLLADYAKHVLLPEKDFADFKRPEPTIPRSPGHYAEWLDACKTGKPTSADFEYSGWLTEANHLGNVAYRAGKKLEWDAGIAASEKRPGSRPIHPPGVPQGLGSVIRRFLGKSWQTVSTVVILLPSIATRRPRLPSVLF